MAKAIDCCTFDLLVIFDLQFEAEWIGQPWRQSGHSDCDINAYKWWDVLTHMQIYTKAPSHSVLVYLVSSLTVASRQRGQRGESDFWVDGAKS